MKIKYRNREVEATDVEVLRVNEPWTECQLADGKVLMFKDVIVSVHKLAGEVNPDGGPIYVFQTNRTIRVK